jgi:hypothetical protein
MKKPIPMKPKPAPQKPAQVTRGSSPRLPGAPAPKNLPTPRTAQAPAAKAVDAKAVAAKAAAVKKEALKRMLPKKGK